MSFLDGYTPMAEVERSGVVHAEKVQMDPADWPVWYCICVQNDCEATFWGPFKTEEEARREASGGCDFAHVTRRSTFWIRGSYRGGPSTLSLAEKVAHCEWWLERAERYGADEGELESARFELDMWRIGG